MSSYNQNPNRYDVALGALLMLTVTQAGCGGLGALTGPAKSPVTAARIDPGGHGLFVIRPPSGPDGCNIAVQGSAPLECDNEYLVSCDATLPDNEPFCRVTPELGPVRESIYPARVP